MPKLCQLFVNSASSRVLDYFITNQSSDHPLSKVAAETGVSYKTVKEAAEELRRTNVIKKTRSIGKSELYRINLDSPAVKHLLELYKTA